MRYRSVVFWMALALWLLAALTPSGARAQEEVSLNAVESYMAQGRIEEARGILQLWFSDQGARASRSDRQRSLWLRAKLTVDPSMAEGDLRRLVLEYPGGSYSDDALFRLALFAHARGDLREAQEKFQELARNYPVSPFARDAQRWLEEHREELAALPPPGREAPREPILEEEPKPVTPVPRGDFAVQAGAFQSLERARALGTGLGDAGFEARLVRVPGSELVRVRVGRFPTREEAEAFARRLESRGFEVTIATDAESEEGVG